MYSKKFSGRDEKLWMMSQIGVLEPTQKSSCARLFLNMACLSMLLFYIEAFQFKM